MLAVSAQLAVGVSTAASTAQLVFVLISQIGVDTVGVGMIVRLGTFKFGTFGGGSRCLC